MESSEYPLETIALASGSSAFNFLSAFSYQGTIEFPINKAQFASGDEYAGKPTHLLSTKPGLQNVKRKTEAQGAQN